MGEKQIRVNGWIFWPARRKMVALSGAVRKALILKSETLRKDNNKMKQNSNVND